MVETGTKYQYKITPGLAHLLTNADTNPGNFKRDDMEKYLLILVRSGVDKTLEDTSIKLKPKKYDINVRLEGRKGARGHKSKYRGPDRERTASEERYAHAYAREQAEERAIHESQNPDEEAKAAALLYEKTKALAAKAGKVGEDTKRKRKQAPPKSPGIAQRVTPHKEFKGDGVATVFLSSNPKKLMKRLDILVVEAEAGNPSGMEEASAILDHLKVDKRTYSKIIRRFAKR